MELHVFSYSLRCLHAVVEESIEYKHGCKKYGGEEDNEYDEECDGDRVRSRMGA